VKALKKLALLLANNPSLPVFSFSYDHFMCKTIFSTTEKELLIFYLGEAAAMLVERYSFWASFPSVLGSPDSVTDEEVRS
jgi:hypothetical protein